jgi:hypothetical protein
MINNCLIEASIVLGIFSSSGSEIRSGAIMAPDKHMELFREINLVLALLSQKERV